MLSSPYIHSQLILDKDAKKFGKRKQFFNKCAGTTDHLHAKE
jgi:hypothetical protein